MMLTRCPVCATTFRVTSDQLRARQGKVRCGECQSVFNALESLVEEPLPYYDLPAMPGTTDAPSFAATPATFAAPPEPQVPAALEIDAAAQESPAAAPGEAPEDVVEPEAPPEAGDPPSPAENAADESAALTDMPPSPTALPEPQAPVPADDDGPDPFSPDPVDPVALDLPAQEPILLEAPRPRRRWPWIAGCVIAGILILLQLVVHFRDALAVADPAFKPALQALCQPLGCTLSLPRQVGQLSIETSDLHPDPAHPEHLLLTAQLRNVAPFPQPWPALELTLTDIADRVLLVRTLRPEDYLPPGPAPEHGFPARSEQPVTLTLDPGGLPAAGYRLYLYFP